MRGTASSRAYPREAGFTLVELMVAMAIAAVLLGVGLLGLGVLQGKSIAMGQSSY